MQPVHWRDFIPATVGKWKLFAHTHWCRQTDRVTVLSAFVKSIFFKRESKSVCIWKSSIKPSRLSFIFKTLHSLIPDFFRTINYKVQLFWLNPYRRSPKTWMKCRFYRVRKSETVSVYAAQFQVKVFLEFLDLGVIHQLNYSADIV